MCRRGGPPQAVSHTGPSTEQVSRSDGRLPPSRKCSATNCESEHSVGRALSAKVPRRRDQRNRAVWYRSSAGRNAGRPRARSKAARAARMMSGQSMKSRAARAMGTTRARPSTYRESVQEVSRGKEAGLTDDRAPKIRSITDSSAGTVRLAPGPRPRDRPPVADLVLASRRAASRSSCGEHLTSCPRPVRRRGRARAARLRYPNRLIARRRADFMPCHSATLWQRGEASRLSGSARS